MTDLSRIEIVGAGPAGLYVGILLKEAFPNAAIRLTEQNPSDATFGFGVVFSDEALDFLKADDPATHALITPEMERWRNMTLVHRGETVTIDGVGFSAIGRLELLQLLQKRAAEAGLDMRFNDRVTSLDALDADLVIGADGLNSLVRTSDPEAFGASIEHFENHFAWFGTTLPFDTLTQTFVTTNKGTLNAHHYRYAPGMSTFIVECDKATFEAYGFADMDETETARVCEEIFADTLKGHKLVTNNSIWRNFPRLWCDTWVTGNRALLGDAVHTAHYSIGSGTRLAMEDAIALVRALKSETSVADALAAYQETRQPIARKIVNAANTSALWYDHFAEHMKLAPLDFAFAYITRSGRVDMERLRRIAPGFMAAYEDYRAGHADTEAVIRDPVGTTDGDREVGYDKTAHPNCSAVLFDNLDRNPDKIAVTGPAGTLTYRALCAEAARWGNAFKAAGCQRGERIVFFVDDTPSYPAAFFGAVRAGFVPVLLNTQATPDLLRFFVADTGARIALCEAPLMAIFEDPEMRAAGLERVIIANGEGPLADGFEHAGTFLDGQPATLEAADTGPDDMAFWMYSSGSTGRPKGIVHLHHDMAYSEASYGRTVLKLEADDVCFSVPKIFFAYGFGNAFTFPFSVGATTVLLPGRPEADRILDMIETFKPTVFFGLPTLYTALARADGVRDRNLSSIRLSVSAAETLSEDVYTTWKDLTGKGPMEGLGSTELLHIYLSNTQDEHRLGSAGKRVPGYEVILRDPDGNPVGDGEEGVMWVRGHSSAPLYWNRPEQTAKTMRDDWIYTGDRFVEDGGFYFFQGRADELIKVSGQWVWPLEVERCLNEHPHVQECAVLAHQLPDRRMTLRAIVALRPGHEPGDDETTALQSFVKERLIAYKYPRIVEFVGELPKTGTGKIDRQALVRTDGDDTKK
ncbi:benzoate-CoA ligase family protein [Amorphus orientalis]|uniref:Benzoate-CoA ligase family protein n=1 Tax=Amorphus orientalis TaxID=649198 RepID=A0AAE4AUD0_9HYPH|nr:benzoate-CoA ligase family protein [Amorphus orientalis]MDQ0317293.1 benzoate-CoA ligase family protein [Amorphus orientalis]